MEKVQKIPASPNAPDYSIEINSNTYESKLINTNQGVIETVVVGEGRPLLILHGIFGGWWQLVCLAELLMEDYKIILVSRPGYGRTPLSSGITMKTQSALYSELLKVLNIPKVNIMGFSGGGPCALVFALNHSDQCKSLILTVSAVPHMIKLKLPEWLISNFLFISKAFNRFNRKKIGENLKNYETAYKFILKNINPDEVNILENNPRLRNNINILLQNDYDGVSPYIGMNNDFKFSLDSKRKERILAENVNVPTLILHGTPDVIVPTEHAVYYASVIPNADLKIYQGASHMVLYTHLDEVADDISTFISSKVKDLY